MALITEDGTGLSTAESLCSVAFANAYHSNRGNAAWSALGSDPVREQLLRKATDYMEQMYREQWAGHRFYTTQALSWPRYGVPMRDAGSFYASDAVPVIVANACAELALRAISGALAPDIGRLKSRVKIGPIETEYVAGSSNTRYRAIDQMLRPFLNGSGGMNVNVVRA
jgi:hypothetical protein